MARRFVGETISHGTYYTAFLRIQESQGRVTQVIHLSRDRKSVKFASRHEARTALAFLIRGLRMFRNLREHLLKARAARLREDQGQDQDPHKLGE